MNRIINFLEENIHNLKLNRSHPGFGIRTSNFDLNSFDYLLKAEEALDSLKTKPTNKLLKNELIHLLKTAMECQLDIFINAYCIDYKKLNVPKKLKILEVLNIISSTTLARLNKLRNEIVHDYKLVDLKIHELEVFFDLTKNLIWVLQPLLTLNHLSRTLSFEGTNCKMEVRLNEFAPLIQFDLKDKNINEQIDFDLLNFKSIYEFIEILKIQLLLSQFNSFDNKTLLLKLIKTTNTI